jgi:hypothetical protein
MLSWLRRRRERKRHVEAKAKHFAQTYGSGAYDEARILERQAITDAKKREWKAVARAISRMTRKRIGVDVPSA